MVTVVFWVSSAPAASPLTYTLPSNQGELSLDLGGNRPTGGQEAPPPQAGAELPQYLGDVRHTLEAVLRKADLSIWLMVDRLDEIFPRRSPLERTALRGLLRAMRILSSDPIRVKIFLRDDMLEQVVEGKDGFVGLTHIMARQADTLRWTEDQILSMVGKRIFANRPMREYLGVDIERLEASAEYRTEAFYMVFPPKCTFAANRVPLLHGSTSDARMAAVLSPPAMSSPC